MIDGNRCSVFAAVLAVSFSAAAQDGGVPQTPIELPKPPPELEQLKPLEGSWSCKGTVPAGAMGPGSHEQSYRSTMKIKKTMNVNSQVGETAEKVWDALSSAGPLMLAQLAPELRRSMAGSTITTVDIAPHSG